MEIAKNQSGIGKRRQERSRFSLRGNINEGLLNNFAILNNRCFCGSIAVFLVYWPEFQEKRIYCKSCIDVRDPLTDITFRREGAEVYSLLEVFSN